MGRNDPFRRSTFNDKLSVNYNRNLGMQLEKTPKRTYQDV